MHDDEEDDVHLAVIFPPNKVILKPGNNIEAYVSDETVNTFSSIHEHVNESCKLNNCEHWKEEDDIPALLVAESNEINNNDPSEENMADCKFGAGNTWLLFNTVKYLLLLFA